MLGRRVVQICFLIVFLTMASRESGITTLQNKTTMHRRSKSYGCSRLGVNLTSYGYTSLQLTAVRMPTSRKTLRSRNITENVDPEQIAHLVKHEWNLSYVTPLYQFRYTDLKFYSKQLSAFIVAETHRGIAVESGSQNIFKVEFSVIPGLTESEEDAKTVFIQIRSRSAFVSDSDAPKVVWSGWFTCVNGNLDYLKCLHSDFVCLPLFCTSGSQSITSAVKSWFSRTFDCCFGSLSLTGTVLRWLATLWIGCHPTSNIRYLKLAWRLPVLPPLDISYAVNPQDAWDLWRSIQEEDSGEDDSISIDQVERYMKGLESHFFRHFRIHLSAGVLMKVSTALGSAHHDGKIKITHSSYITPVLTLLTECAILRMPI